MPGAGMSHFTHPGDLDLRGLGLILDVGHASISGCLDEWLDDPRATLRHLHVHDNHGEGDHDDPHMGLGAGVVDVAAVMAAARAAGASVMLEHRFGRRRADQPRSPAGARPPLALQHPQRPPPPPASGGRRVVW